MSAWLAKWGTLAGVLSGLLAAVAVVSGANTPNSDASGQQVLAWYTAHHAGQELSTVCGVLAMLFLVLFAAAMTRHVRQGEPWVAVAALAGAVAAAVGFTSVLSFGFILASDTAKLSPASAQTLMVLANDFYLPVVLGFTLFGVLGGLAVVAGRILPAAMGWVLFALGLVMLIPGISWFALLATLLWVLIAGIWLTRRGPSAAVRETVVAGEQVPSLT
jgi:hypothetical protein